MEKYGIKETKEALSFLFTVGMAYDKAQADGDVTFTDGYFLIDPLMKAVPAFDKINEVGREMADLSEEEKKELHDFVKAEFNIADDKLEETIEEAVTVIAPLASFLLKFKK